MKTKIHFIVNPVAGSSKNQLSEEYLRGYYDDSNYDIKIKESHYAKHAIMLAKESILQDADIVLACGSDGTINEVASCLVNTSVVLGIIPMGSGNRLASNLKIPGKIVRGIQVIKNKNVIEIDGGMINNELFFSNAGIGFAAYNRLEGE